MRRYQYQQRKSPSTQTHGSRKQSPQTAKAAKLSVIRANGTFERREHPTDERICVFRNSYQLTPVEPRFVGVIPTSMQPQFNPSENPWYLCVTNFLYLERVRSEDSIAYMSTHCFRIIQSRDVSMYEFGRHLYVNSDGYLCMFEIFKTFRLNEIYYSHQYYINDVLPKIRIEYYSVRIRDDEEEYGKVIERSPKKNNLINTLSISAAESPMPNEWQNSRYWHKYGRESSTRFCEWRSIEELYGYGGGTILNLISEFSYLWKIVKSDPFYGIYVDSGAKLILRDRDSKDYNHTLVQSGVFIVLQSEFSFTFMDNSSKVYSLKDLGRIGLLPNNREPKNPIIALKPVPSIGGSICWGLTIEGVLVGNKKTYFGKGLNDFRYEGYLTVTSILNVPLLGMNLNRMSVYDWDMGYEFVSNSQREYDYTQFATTERNRVRRDANVSLPKFISGERLEYPRI